MEALEHEVKRLEQDLSVARQAESHLEVQRQENLQLKETIDRMRFELDEAKSTAQGHSRGATGSSGVPTLSRNLGAEISRRLVEAEVQEAEEEDSYVETVVTRQRTRVGDYDDYVSSGADSPRKSGTARRARASLRIYRPSASKRTNASMPMSASRRTL